jgi:CubicO group peptidase (beta-lactamase class C family)
MNGSHWRAAASAVLVLVAPLGSPHPVNAQEADDPGQRVNEVFAAWDHTNSPGCSVGVIKDGEFIYRRGYGMASLELGVALTSESVFYIGSTSKQFVAASIILAAEQGFLSLDDDIRDYLPEMPDYGKTITIRHLLHHTSGVRDYLTLWALAGENIEDIHSADNALAMIARQKALNFEPGEEYLYSNSGYFLLSVILERATDQSLREFSQKNIFEPLGMENTHFHDDHTHTIPNRAIGHLQRDDGSVALHLSNFSQVGSGGLYTSVDDLLLWDRNFYDNKLGNDGLIERMLVRGILNNGDTLSYATALVLGEYRGLRTVEHGGALGGYRAQLLRFPDQRFSVICLCNYAPTNPGQLAYQVADIYLANEFVETEETGEAAPEMNAVPELVEIPEADLAVFNGAYRNPQTGTIWRITARGHQLNVDIGNFEFQLDAVSENDFIVLNQPFQIEARFVSDSPDGRRRIDAVVNGESASYHEVELVSPGPSELLEYAGDYYSDELDVTWTLEVREGALYVALEADEALEPTVQDEFVLQGVTLMFTRNVSGSVSGIEVDAGRVTGLVFEKRS